MEKGCPGQEDQPPSRVNFTGRLYEKKVDPSAESRAGFANDNSAGAYSDRLSLTQLTRLGEQKCLYGEKLARLEG